MQNERNAKSRLVSGCSDAPYSRHATARAALLRITYALPEEAASVRSSRQISLFARALTISVLIELSLIEEEIRQGRKEQSHDPRSGGFAAP